MEEESLWTLEEAGPVSCWPCVLPALRPAGCKGPGLSLARGLPRCDLFMEIGLLRGGLRCGPPYLAFSVNL